MHNLLFIVTVSVLLIAGLVAYFMTVSSVNVNNRKSLLWALVFAIVLSGMGFSGALGYVSRGMVCFFAIQVASAAMGWLAAFLIKKKHWGDLSASIMGHAGYLLMNAAAGMLGFYFVFSHFAGGDLAQLYALGVIPFVLAGYLGMAYDAYRAIPHAIYKIWHFPLNAEEVDYESIDTRVVYMMELEYSKSVNDTRLTNTKLRAPMGIKFGDWFRSFVEGYNDRNSHDPIHYAYADKAAMGWIFYVKPSFLGTARFVDPELTIQENKLTEKNVIIARRVEVLN